MTGDDIWLTKGQWLQAVSLTGVLDWSQQATDNSQATGGETVRREPGLSRHSMIM